MIILVSMSFQSYLTVCSQRKLNLLMWPTTASTKITAIAKGSTSVAIFTREYGNYRYIVFLTSGRIRYISSQQNRRHTELVYHKLWRRIDLRERGKRKRVDTKLSSEDLQEFAIAAKYLLIYLCGHLAKCSQFTDT